MKFIAKSTLAILSGVAFTHSAQADVVHADDVIIQFSQCVGSDCANGENFGFDTQRLKENNLRIHFDDTSNSASFPSNDWRLVANDTSNGGTSHFSIQDSTAGRSPFRVEAGAPANSLVVESDGDIGIKTLNPVVDLHIVEGNTPTVRFEQDGSDGFTPQTWDMAGNEANFFIRDVTNGSRLPLQIKPGADSGSLFVAANGDVGMGTSTPNTALHISDTSGSGGQNMLRLQNNGNPELVFENTNVSKSWEISAGLNLIMREDGGPGGNLFTLSPTGDLTIAGGLISVGGGGNCTVADPCDRVFDKNVYEIPSIEEHAKSMWENKYLPSVGPTGADEPINMTVKMLRMLNELEKAHVYIEQLNERLVELEEKLVQQ
ncbi:hypothetical protein [Arenicella xantha]|uniref:Uncharacterized protein n=1 Tax=Arenicella xantha TaxID=644221 RepID=A0A395JQJ1_9GAMM|nr:hypothetical protein [Arenicella xantha]RBP50990.1 hypothetical protein DFR28_102407 [Arenicella xantha]